MINEYINTIKQHYQDNDNMLIVGIGDERGVNIEKNLLLVLKELLTTEDYDINTIDAFSTLLNKNRYIDSYLSYNISSDKLKKIQMYGLEESIKNKLNDNTLTKGLGVLGSYMIKSANNKELYLSDEIKNNKEPIIIYSSGINDLIDKITIQPSQIKDKYYKNRVEYDNAIKNISGEKYTKNINELIDDNERHFTKILGLNDQAKLLILGPHLYYKTELYNRPFQNYVIAYSERLKDLCRKYNITYVGTRSIEKTPYQNPSNKYFRKNTYFLASRILRKLYYDIDNKRDINVDEFKYNSEGVYGVLRDHYDYVANLKKNNPRKYVETEDERKSVEKTLKRTLYERD